MAVSDFFNRLSYFMKNFTFCLMVFSLISLDRLHGQCLSNGTFSGACTNTIALTGGLCPTWTDACGDGWVRSHGTPQIFTYQITNAKVPVTVNGAYMWSAVNSIDGKDYGEGMFTNYAFTAGQIYDIIMNFSVLGNALAANGTVYVYAANGMSQSALTACSGLISGVSYSSRQLIGVYSVTANGSYDYIFPPFTANANYSQLWIYPSANSTDQFNLSLTGVYSCLSCRVGPTYTQNTGLLPVTVNGGDIYAGSSSGSGGSGIVGVQASQATVLNAIDAVYFLPDFQAVITGTGSFTAEITPPCTLNAYVGPIVLSDKNEIVHHAVPPNIMDSLAGIAAATHPSSTKTNTIANQDSQKDNFSDKIRVFPTVSTGTVTVSGSSDVFTNSDILVADESGRVVYRSHIAEATSLTLDLSKFKNGFYILQLKSNSGVVAQKIIIQK
jgi:hypothetical protein